MKASRKRELIRARTGEGRERAKAQGVKMVRKPKLIPPRGRLETPAVPGDPSSWRVAPNWSQAKVNRTRAMMRKAGDRYSSPRCHGSRQRS